MFARSIALGRVLLSMAFVSVLVANTIAADAPRLIEIEGVVEIRRGPSGSWAPGKLGDSLNVGDVIRTGARSRVAVRLSDSSVIRKGELTTVQFSPPKPGSDKPVLDLLGGLLFFFSREKKDESQIHVPGAAGAIRGTEFAVSVAHNGDATFTMLDGVVDLENDQGKQTLTSGEQAIVSPGSAPKKTAVLMAGAKNSIQWALYYPAVLNLDELGLQSNRLAEVVTLYRMGDIPSAVAAWPSDYAPTEPKEKIFYAGLLLASGNIQQAESVLKDVDPMSEATQSELLLAVRWVSPDWNSVNGRPFGKTASAQVAISYVDQKRGDLPRALADAHKAAVIWPSFGFAWARIAELEFGFGRIEKAREAAEKALQLTPRNAQAHALLGFLAAARNRNTEAIDHFNKAIEIDGALGNAWLGRGLIELHQGHHKEALEDLQTAVVMEPNRAILRSYLAKAAADTGDLQRAKAEADLGLRLDELDPTTWFYRALIEAQANELNSAVDDLEKSKELNNNRELYRSKLLLDQDQAVRRVNLAGIYRDVGMTEVSVREASRAVADDYANSSAHLFLASSYDSLRDPRQTNLRYDTAWFSELLLADLLAPPGVGTLSQTISQQEYSRLFAQDGLHLASGTEYQSSGRWFQYGSQSGVFGGSSYSIDTSYSSLDADHANSDFEQVTVWGRFKQTLTPHDTVFVMANYYDAHAGDARVVFDPSNPAQFSPTLRIHESQEPNVFAGLRHEWQPGANTLLFVGHLDDLLRARDTAGLLPVIALNPNDTIFRGIYAPFNTTYRSSLEVWTAEAQHIQEFGDNRLIAGARYQSGRTDTDATAMRPQVSAGNPAINRILSVTTDLDRASAYAYAHIRPMDRLQLIGGFTYDRLVYPDAISAAPIIASEHETQSVTPKAGFIFNITDQTFLRGAYARSLGGAFNDTTVRLEPVQIAGFVDAFRSGAAESVAGQTPGSHFESFNLGLEHRFPTRTYVGIDGGILNAEGSRRFGAFNLPNRIPFVSEPEEIAVYGQGVDFRERSIAATMNQLIAESWSVGAKYRLTDSKLNIATPAIPKAAFPAAYLNDMATLHQFQTFAIINHHTGFFAEADANLYSQSTSVFAPGRDTFWQFNVFAGWRFPNRRAELSAGILNLSDRDYRLDPLNISGDLARNRTFVARFKFAF